jgi:uncharacterized membrane protein
MPGGENVRMRRSDAATWDAAEHVGRFGAVDVARGVALAAMFVYHFTWDIGFFGLINLNVAENPSWRVFAKLIASSFLLLVGVSLVLATQHGLKPRPYLKRLALVAGAAALVSLGTWFATPQSFVYFGILHSIALASVLALPFLGLPVWIVVVMAAIIATLPRFATSDLFNQPWLWWTGLSSMVPATNDYVPIIPWFAAVLAGIALARWTLPRLNRGSVLARPPGNPATRLLAFGGRHSLIVYLVHQPLFFAALWLFTTVTGLPREDPDAFQASCVTSCVARDMDEALCRSICSCVADDLKGTTVLSRRSPSVADQHRIAEAVAICRKLAEPPPKLE